MKVRDKTKQDVEISSGKFNTHGIGEVICFWEDGDCDSMFVEDLEVFIEANGIGWKDMGQAFKTKTL